MTRPLVFLVEDDEWLGELFVDTLSHAGFRTKHVPHAIEAMEQIDKDLPDVLVLDVLLTATTAFTLLHELQSYVDTGSIPVILCTNLADTLSIDDVRPYGVRRILDKVTMEPADLVAAVRSVL